jgi:hypothetical protein
MFGSEKKIYRGCQPVNMFIFGEFVIIGSLLANLRLTAKK